MAKSKPDLTTLIPDPQRRRVTLSKRKKQLLLSAIELSSLCGQKIFLAIFDEDKQRMVHFSSQADFTIGAVHSQAKSLASIDEPDHRIESFTNKDYHLLKQKDFRKRQARKAIRRNPSPKLSDFESESSDEVDQYSAASPIRLKRQKKSQNSDSHFSPMSKPTSTELQRKDQEGFPEVVGLGDSFWFDLLSRKLPHPIEQAAPPGLSPRPAPESKGQISSSNPSPAGHYALRTTSSCGTADPTTVLRQRFPLAKPKTVVVSSRIVILS